MLPKTFASGRSRAKKDSKDEDYLVYVRWVISLSGCYEEDLLLQPIQRLPNLQLQRQRCSNLHRAFF
jgi:hypothetical protein